MSRRALSIDLRVYPLPVVKRAGYRMAHRCTLVLGARDGDALAVTLNFPDGVSATSQQAAEDEFHRHLLDEDLRACIRAETDALRGVILAHTFSRTDILLR